MAILKIKRGDSKLTKQLKKIGNKNYTKVSNSKNTYTAKELLRKAGMELPTPKKPRINNPLGFKYKYTLYDLGQLNRKTKRDQLRAEKRAQFEAAKKYRQEQLLSKRMTKAANVAHDRNMFNIRRIDILRNIADTNMFLNSGNSMKPAFKKAYIQSSDLLQKVMDVKPNKKVTKTDFRNIERLEKEWYKISNGKMTKKEKIDFIEKAAKKQGIANVRGSDNPYSQWLKQVETSPTKYYAEDDFETFDTDADWYTQRQWILREGAEARANIESGHYSKEDLRKYNRANKIAGEDSRYGSLLRENLMEQAMQKGVKGKEKKDLGKAMWAESKDALAEGMEIAIEDLVK